MRPALPAACVFNPQRRRKQAFAGAENRKHAVLTARRWVSLVAAVSFTQSPTPHPETLITENIESAREFTQSLLDQGKEVVLKQIALSRGTGVTKLSRIRSRKDLTQYLVWYTRNFAEGVYYLQEFVPNKGHDIRIFIIDGRVVGREMRSNPDDFRYNVATGGSAAPFEEDTYDELAIKVAEAAGLKITGLDILPREDGSPIVLEANCYPGYKALMETTGVPIHELIVDYFQSLLKS